MPEIHQIRLSLDKSNIEWLSQMESIGVSKSSVVNLAINMLRPRLTNIGTTDELIKQTIAESPLEY